MQNYGIKFKNLKFLIAVLIAVFLVSHLTAAASKIDELKGQIKEKAVEKAKIEKDIKKYEKQIDETLKEKNTLKNEVYRLRINAKKLNSNIYLTRKKIEASGFNIEKLSFEITGKNKEISSKKKMLAEIIRDMNETESQSLVEITLAHDKFSDFFSDLERMKNIQDGINSNLDELKKLKIVLQKEKTEKQAEREKQKRLKSELVDRKYLVDRNKENTDKLLEETKNKEANYRKRLKEKIAQKEAFARELFELESQLRMVIDPDSLPPAGSGIFAPPLSDVSYKSCYNGSTKAKNCITQYFGDTPFAKSGAYDGRVHNGMDFRARYGPQKVKAVLGGTVVRANSDVAPNCQYGKWVVIKHNNGLTTLYAHMSLVKATSGQKVDTGDVIGYTGNTGYSTAPHLHLTTYASQAVVFKDYNCKSGLTVSIPIAPFNAYLNPLDYL